MRMTEGFAFFPLTFDEEGTLQAQDELDALDRTGERGAAGHGRHLSGPRLSE